MRDSAAQTIPKSLERWAERIEFYDDERGSGSSIIVTLKSGWEFKYDPLQATHVLGEDNVADIRSRLQSSGPCKCEECLRDASKYVVYCISIILFNRFVMLPRQKKTAGARCSGRPSVY